MTVGGLIDDIFERPPELGITLALVVLKGGDVVAERYGTAPDTPFGPGGPVDAGTRLISWSTAKSMVHAAVGVLVKDGALDPVGSCRGAAWAGTDKEAITVLDLLEMRPGLRFVEDYVDGDASHCIDMLFGSGGKDHAAYAAEPAARPSAGDGLELLVRHDQHHLSDRRRRRRWRRAAAGWRCVLSATALFGPVGMDDGRAPLRRRRHLGRLVVRHMPARSTSPASASCTAMTASSAASGSCRRAGSTMVARSSPTTRSTVYRADSTTDDTGGCGRPSPASIAAHGYEGQYVVVVPDRELVVVHLGKTPAGVRNALIAQLHELVRALLTSVPRRRRSGSSHRGTGNRSP